MNPYARTFEGPKRAPTSTSTTAPTTETSSTAAGQQDVTVEVEGDHHQGAWDEHEHGEGGNGGEGEHENAFYGDGGYVVYGDHPQGGGYHDAYGPAYGHQHQVCSFIVRRVFHVSVV